MQYVLTGGVLHVLGVTGGGASASRLGRLDVGPARFMLADGPRLLVVGVSLGGSALTRLTRVDASRPGAPVVTSFLTVDGVVGIARSTGGTATLTVKTDTAAPVNDLWATVQAAGGRLAPAVRRIIGGRRVSAFEGARKAALVAAVNATDDAFWVPQYTLRRRGRDGRDAVVAAGPLAACRRTYRPVAFAGYTLLAVLRVAVGEAAAAAEAGRLLLGGVAIASGDGTAYAAAAALYVTTRAYQGDSRVTAVHKFDTPAAGATYVASGAVRWRLLSLTSQALIGLLMISIQGRPAQVRSSVWTGVVLRARRTMSLHRGSFAAPECGRLRRRASNTPTYT